MTYSTLTGDLFGEPLTSSQAASLASHSQQPESERAETMNDISFRKCFELFQRSDRVGSSLKMFAVCLVSNLDEYSPKLSHHWKAKATRSLRFVFLLQPSKLRTGEIDCGLWENDDMERIPLGTPRAQERPRSKRFLEGADRVPTPSEMVEMLLTPSTVNIEPKEGRYEKRKAYRESIGRQWVPGGLAEQVAMLPTPKARTGADCPSERQRHTPSLDSQIAMLPPPATRDYKGANSPEHMTKGDGRNHMGQLPNAIEVPHGEKTGLKLQPAFVEWMMGFPMNYTSLEAETTGSAA